MSDIIARGMAANAMSSGGGGGGGTTVDAYSKNETDSLLRGKANASDVYTTTQTDDLLDDKVNKVSGKGLSTNDYTNEDMSLVKTISNKANTNDVNASITNLQNQISETSENVDTINTELMTNAGYSLGMSINPTTFELTMTLKNSTGGTVSSQRVDLPIESMVVDASYANGNLNLTLQNGTSLSVDISSIVSGLVKDTFKIAGIDMKDNIEANELRAALGVYTTTEVDNKLGQKANASTTYSKTEVDNKVSAINTNVQANTTAINATNERVTQNENDISLLEENKLNFAYFVAQNTTTTAGWFEVAKCDFVPSGSGNVRDIALCIQLVNENPTVGAKWAILNVATVIGGSSASWTIDTMVVSFIVNKGFNTSEDNPDIIVVGTTDGTTVNLAIWCKLQVQHAYCRGIPLIDAARVSLKQFNTPNYWQLLNTSTKHDSYPTDWERKIIPTDYYGGQLKSLSDRITALENK